MAASAAAGVFFVRRHFDILIYNRFRQLALMNNPRAQPFVRGLRVEPGGLEA